MQLQLEHRERACLESPFRDAEQVIDLFDQRGERVHVLVQETFLRRMGLELADQGVGIVDAGPDPLLRFPDERPGALTIGRPGTPLRHGPCAVETPVSAVADDEGPDLPDSRAHPVRALEQRLHDFQERSAGVQLFDSGA
jgi:hypothetical protein